MSDLIGIQNSVRNSEGIWINSSLFQEEALHFKKYGYYCSDPWESPAWYDYWNEQDRRIKEGYSVGGAKITGDHYFYLNFFPIMKTEDMNSKKSKKSRDFPDFWDGDYDYFWCREIARDGIIDSLVEDETERWEIHHADDDTKTLKMKALYESLGLEVKILPDHLGGGYNLIVGKSRRKGYSYKNASIGAKNFISIPESFTIYGAYEKKYLYPAKNAIFTMALNSLNFLREHTCWAPPVDFVNKQDHVRNSFEESVNGVRVERGLMSEMMALTFKDNPDAARGKDARDIILEESGAFGTPGLLKESYNASVDCVKDGEIKTGLITIFGTSGDMESGTADYAEMYNDPLRFDLLPFENIWEDDIKIKGGKVGFFHPANKNMPGYYDEQGNSFVKEAKEFILSQRKAAVDRGATVSDMRSKLQERPLTPREAFSYTNINKFPVEELQRRKDIVIANGWQRLKGQPVVLYRDSVTHKVVCEPDLAGKLEPITSYESGADKEGCPVIYEFPIPNAPRGLYKIGYDPVRQVQGTSLAAYVVYKGTMVGSWTRECIVAEFIGRRDNPDDNHLIGELLAELYSTQVMYENEVPDVKTYFQRRRLLKLLALQPDQVISKNVKNSTVNRVYGCHMNGQLKEAGENYIVSWLNTVLDFDEAGNPITVIDTINSVRLLEELINYNKKGNFDLVSALIMCLIQVQEQILGKEYEEKKASSSASILLSMKKNMYKNNSSTRLV